MFEELGAMIREEVVLTLFHVEVAEARSRRQLAAGARRRQHLSYEHESSHGADAIARGGRSAAATAVAAPPLVAAGSQQRVNEHHDVGRNDPCWCGSRQEVQEAATAPDAR